MSTRDLLLEGFERAINALLLMDETAAQQLSQHHGKTVALHLRGLELTLYMIPDHAGKLQVFGQIEGTPDATLSGSPLDLMQSKDAESGAAQLFGGNLSISGDTHLAKSFGTTLGNLDIDWEEQLSRITGDIIAHKVGHGARAATAYGKASKRTLEQNLGEYLTEEARLLPHPYEVEAFVEEVDTLRDDAERLLARLQRLEKSS